LAPSHRPRRANDTTSQGRPHANFRRAIDAGNVVPAEIAAHELRGLSLEDALDLTALVALRNCDRSRRMAKWWRRSGFNAGSTGREARRSTTLR
jgi:hypothetical protein